MEVIKGDHLSNKSHLIRGSFTDHHCLYSQTQLQIRWIKDVGTFINYYGEESQWEQRKIATQGADTYFISDIDQSDKYSEGYRNCIGIVIAGTSRETGQSVSLLTHQHPSVTLPSLSSESKFEEDMEKRAIQLLEESLPGTIDAAIFGGNMLVDYIHDYSLAVEKNNSLIKSILGFSAVCLGGPKLSSGDQAFYFDTQKRILHICREQHTGETTNESFSAENIKNKSDAWLEEAFVKLGLCQRKRAPLRGALPDPGTSPG